MARTCETELTCQMEHCMLELTCQMEHCMLELTCQMEHCVLELTCQMEHCVLYELLLRPVQEPEEVDVLRERWVLPAASLEGCHVSWADDTYPEVCLHCPVVRQQ